MLNKEILFQYAIKVLKEDIDKNYTNNIVREIFIDKNQLVHLYGNYDEKELNDMLKELVSYKYCGEMFGNIYENYTNVCPSFTYTNDGVVLHMYPMAIRFARK